MSTGKLVLGTLAGLTIGAAAGLLFASRKASKTRNKIMDKDDDYLHQLKIEITKKDAEYLAAKGKFVDAGKDARNATSDIKYSVS